MNRLFLGGALLCAAVATPLAGAQSHDGHGAHVAPGKPSALSTPPDTATSGPDRANTRSLATYRSYAEPALSPWLQSNAQVAKAGGWRAYARESQAPTGPSASSPPDASPKDSDAESKQLPHGGHSQ